MNTSHMMALFALIAVNLVAGNQASNVLRPTPAEIRQGWIQADQDRKILRVELQPATPSERLAEQDLFLAAAEMCITKLKAKNPLTVHKVFGIGTPGIIPDFDPDSGVPLETVGCEIEADAEVQDAATRWVLGWYRSHGVLAVNSQLNRMLWSVPGDLTWVPISSSINGMYANVVPDKRPLINPPKKESDWFTYHVLRIKKPDSSSFTLGVNFWVPEPDISWALHAPTRSIWVRFQESGGAKGPFPLALQIDQDTGKILTVHPLVPDSEVVPPYWLEVIRPSKRSGSQKGLSS